jgi:hypothetical protein
VTCDGRDDDCNGAIDDGFMAETTSCGLGVCAQTGETVCSNGAMRDTCVAGAPTSTLDDATFPGNGRDDDCDGTIDEDSVSTCDTTPKTFAAGTFAVSVPAGCTKVTVQLWGGGGGSGARSSGDNGTPGRGGAGGYATSTLTIDGALQLLVGSGGKGCGAGGVSPQPANYSGGAGGEGDITSTDGKPGADTVVAGGGAGGNSTKAGGKGHYGGGGGGGGSNAAWPPYAGAGGGGGAATALLMRGTLAAVAGGGGGGGGMTGFGALAAGPAGNGGEGCAGNGASGNSDGGGGGGGGKCVGTTMQQGTNGVPANNTSLPGSQARGGVPTGSTDCIAGNAGYAILTFGP